MLKTPLPALPVLALLLAPAGCARDATVYPSLAPRPTEKLGFAEPDAPAPVAAAADPVLDARIAALAARLGETTQEFDAALVRAEAAAAKPGARTVGADAWLDAQTAVAALDDYRAQGSAIAAEASDLGAARAQALAPDYPALTRLQAAVEAAAARQSAAIARVQASLPAA